MKKLFLLLLCFVFLTGLTAQDRAKHKAWKKSTKIAEKICEAKGEKYTYDNYECYCNELQKSMNQMLAEKWGQDKRDCNSETWGSIVGNPLSPNLKDNLNPPPSKNTTIKYDEIFPLENAKVNCHNETTDHYYYDFQNLTDGKMGQCKNGYVQLTHLEYEELQRRDNFFTWDIEIIDQLNKQSDIEFNNKCNNWRTRSYSNNKSKEFDGYYTGISKDTYISACVSDRVIGFFHDRNVTGEIKKGGKFSVEVGGLRSIGKQEVGLLMMGGKIKDNIILIEGFDVVPVVRSPPLREDFPNDNNENQDGQGQEGMYVEQNGQMVWVQHQSGYDKFKSNFCVGCSQIYTHMVNRANTRKSQGAALSGFDKYILKVDSFRY